MRNYYVVYRVPALGVVEDIYREARGEIVESRDASTAIGRRTAALFKARLAP